MAGILSNAVVKFKYFHRFAVLLLDWLFERLLTVVDILVFLKQDFEKGRLKAWWTSDQVLGWNVRRKQLRVVARRFDACSALLLAS